MSYTDVKIVSATRYFKPQPNLPRDVRILNETPETVYKHQAKKGQVPCAGSKNGCEWCAQGDTPRQRHLTNVYDYESKRVLIWEFGKMVMQQIQGIENSLKSENMRLLNVDISVNAQGQLLDRKYTITPRMTSQTLPENLKLHELDSELAF